MDETDKDISPHYKIQPVVPQDGVSKGENSAYKPGCLQKYTSARWVLAYQVCLAYLFYMTLPHAMGFAIVCMTTRDISYNFNSSDSFNMSNITNSSLDMPEFQWDSSMQGLILASNFFLATLSPPIGGALCHRFGGKMVVLITYFICAVCSLLTPLAARTHLVFLITAKIVQGFCGNMIFPATNDLWSRWTPGREKVQLVSIGFSGGTLSQIVLFTMSGYLCTLSLDNGWPFIFYVTGGACVVWCGMWCLTVFDSPDVHPRISFKERQYINNTRVGVVRRHDEKIPWRAIATSPLCYTIMVVMFAHQFTMVTFVAFTPAYMNLALKYSIPESGVMSAVPYIGRFTASYFWGFLSDKLRTRLSTTSVRKLVQVVGFGVAGALTGGLGYVTEDTRVVAVCLLTVIMFCHSSTLSSNAQLPLDIAPQFASILTGLMFGVGNLGATVSPLITAYIIRDRTMEQWRTLFYLNMGVFLASGVAFLLFASGDIQPWADNTVHEERELKEKQPLKTGDDNVIEANKGDM
ncbi:uncharacterized transporter slc-17.2-like [Haliotis rufescens]|uniref:uncharacterized transporter slc-17.2-like n=1 Tax=Haliotis rufescens TaxID=6454 RepID=UPI00201EB21A|nr:uncharacterized transporter slc-17.2-like [Haliotis rufescens]